MQTEPRSWALQRRISLSKRCRLEPLESRMLLSASTPPVAGVGQSAAALWNMDDHHAHEVVAVTPTQIITEHDTIPRFVAQPTITSIGNGSFTNPNIWVGNRVPTAGDRVRIGADTVVTYDAVRDVALSGLEINGKLIFSTSVNTRLVVGNLTVMPEGHLEIGTLYTPVAANVKAEIVIADQPLDLAKDPSQYGTGLIAVGDVTIHGATLNRTWNRLAAEPRAGDKSILVSDNVFGWKAGDTLVLPDSRQVSDAWDRMFPAGTVPPQWEEVTIERISGSRVYLNQTLKFDHLGARNSSGQLELLPHVALLDHNVVIRSANPNGTRGHVFFGGRADIDVRFARFKDLGRTDALRSLHITKYDANGNVTQLGTNQVGRYAVHLHHLLGPENPTNTGYQFRFIGNTVDGARKWGVAIHDTSFGLLQNNVIYNAQGAGFVTEDGSEIGNVFDSNITIRIQGTHGDGKSGTLADDFARGGSGFWFHLGGNAVTNNVAVDTTFAGFVIDGYYVDPVTLPNFRGANKHEPGQGTAVSLNPTAPFTNNEAYGMTTFGLWAALVSGDNTLDNQPVTVFEDLRLWHTWIAGVMAYHASSMTFDELLVLGDPKAQVRNDTGSMGMDLRTYENRDVVVRNSRIEGMRAGIVAPRNDASQAGRPRPTIIEDSVLKNYTNIYVMPGQDDRPSNGNSLVVRNVKFTLNKKLPAGPAPASSIEPPANIRMKLTGDAPDLTNSSTVLVYDYNGNRGDDFQVYYREQAASYVMPKTSSTLLGGLGEGLIGSPKAGLTNAQNWSQYGIAVAGAVAPSNAEVVDDIAGLIAPIQNLAAIVPSVVLVTPWDGAVVPTTPPVRVRHNVNGLLPEGSKVYFSWDDGPLYSTIYDGVIWNLPRGQHKLKAFIGDSSGNILPGTKATILTFTI